MQDDKLVLLSDKETISLGITDQELDDNTIEKIIIVYKARKGHYIFQNKLFAMLAFNQRFWTFILLMSFQIFSQNSINFAVPAFNKCTFTIKHIMHNLLKV